MRRGKLILIVGPSGSGKGTLISYVREQFSDLVFPTSYTTRAPRPGEEESGSNSGKRYRFVNEDAFKRAAAAGEFLEWAQYGGHFYGTPKQEIEEALTQGKFVVHELEVQGARQLKERIPKQDLAIIFINAGSWEELERRILARGAMSSEELMQRHERYKAELLFRGEADAVIENRDGELGEAKRRLRALIEEILGA